MPGDIATLGLRVTAAQSIAETDRLDRNLDRLKTSGARARREFSALGLVFAGGLALREIVENTTAAQQAMNQLEATLRSTGGVSGQTVAGLDQLANELQQVTRFSDEQVKSVEALLLTFKKIRGEEFEPAVRVTLDLAQALNTDLRSASLQVGKALEDPATQMSQLRRSGVSFTQQQIEMARAMQEAGDIAGAQALVLRELEAQFGGSAEAAREDLGGALAFLRNQIDDFFEVTDEGSGVFVDAINAMGDAVPRVREILVSFFSGIQILAVESAVGIGHIELALARVGETAAGRGVQGIIGFFDRIGEEIEELSPALARVAGIGEGFGLIDISPLTHLAGVLREDLARSSEDAQANLDRLRAAAEQTIREMFEGLDDVEDFAAGLEDVAEAAEEAERKLRTIFEGPQGETIAAIIGGRELRERSVELEDTAAELRTLFLETAQGVARSFGVALEGVDEDTEQLGREIERSFSDVWQSVTEDGVASFDDLARDAIRIMRSAGREIGDDLGLALSAVAGLGIGSAAGPGAGLFGGAGFGFAAGGPLGAVLGGVSGFVSGLHQQAREAEDAARAMERARLQFTEQLELFVLDITGALDADSESLRRLVRDGIQLALQGAFDELGPLGFPADELQAAFDIFGDLLGPGATTEEIIKGIQALINTFEQLGLETTGLENLLKVALTQAAVEAKEAHEELAEAEAEAADAAARLAEELAESVQSLRVRGLEALGFTDEAARIALRERQRAEFADAPESLRLFLQLVQDLETRRFEFEQFFRTRSEEIRDEAEAQIDALDEQIAIAREDLRVAQEQLRTQERTVEELRDVVETLREFNSGLLLSDLSPLSPVARLTEARGQFRDLVSSALAGDVDAARDLPALARDLLELSRDVNASSPAFVADFELVRAALELVADTADDQLTTEEQTLVELADQTELLEASISEMQALQDQLAADAEREIEALREGFENQIESFREEFEQFLDITQEQTAAVVEPTEAILEETRKSVQIQAEGFGEVVNRLARVERAIIQSGRRRRIDPVNVSSEFS